MNKEDSQNPFPGLRPFYFDDSYLFFGRDSQITELASRLRKNKFLAVVGTSGSGKSSLVRAGLLPELLSGTMVSAGSLWETAIMRPGGDPITNLAESIVQADLYDPEEEEIVSQVRATLTRSGLGLIEAIRQCDIEEGSNLLIVVDQFEEIFRFRGSDDASDEQAPFFVNLLLEATEQSELPIYVIITMRSDFLGDCSGFPRLANSVNEGEFLIPRLNRDQRKEAIEGPIRVAGGEVSKPLLNRLLNDIGDDPDQLPILQHALMRTWGYWAKHSDRDSLDLDDYRATGGMTEALSRHANEVYADLPSDGHRKIAEKVFKNLTEKIDQGRGIRRPMPFGELLEIVQCPEEDLRLVVNEFRAAGRTFLMPAPTREIDLSTVIDISHESLMRVWTRLKDWVDDESQSARIYRRLADTAQLFEEGKAGYYRDPDLQIAMSWKEEAQPNHLWADRYYEGFDRAMQFLDKSYEVTRQEEIDKENARIRELESAKALAAEQEKRAAIEKRSAKRLRVLSAGLALAGIASLVFLAFAINSKNEVSNKINELASRSFLRGQELEKSKDGLKALPWYLDAVDLSKGNESLNAKYLNALSNKLSSNFILEKGINVKDVSELIISEDGKLLVINTNTGLFGAENKIHVYSWPDLREVCELKIDGVIFKTKISPDGGHIFSCSNIESKVWSVSADSKTVFQKPYFGSFSFNPKNEGGYHLFGSSEGLSRIERDFSQESDVHSRRVASAAISPNGNHYISIEELDRDTIGSVPSAVFRRRLFRSGGVPSKIVSFSIKNDSFEQDFESEFEGFISQIIFPDDSPEGIAFFSASQSSKRFTQVNFSTGEVSNAALLDFGGVDPGELQIKSGGDKVLVASSVGSLQILEKQPTGWELVQNLPLSENSPSDLSSNGLDVLTSNSNGSIQLLSAISGDQFADSLYGKVAIKGAIFGPSDERIIVALENGEVKVFSIPIGKVRVTGTPYQSSVSGGRGPWLAVDGIVQSTRSPRTRSSDDFEPTSMSTELGDANPMWRLNFDRVSKVTDAKIWNRPSAGVTPNPNDMFIRRLKNFKVSLKLDGETVWEKLFLHKKSDSPPYPYHEVEFDDGVMADCFEITITDVNENNEKILSLSEVEVFAISENKNVTFGEDLSQYVREVSSHELLADGRVVLSSSSIEAKSFASYTSKGGEKERILSKFLKAYDSQNWTLCIRYFSQLGLNRENSEVVRKAIICYRSLGLFEDSQKLLANYLSNSSPDYKFIVNELCNLDQFGLNVASLVAKVLSTESFYQDKLACKSMSLFLVSSDKYQLSQRLHDWLEDEYNRRDSYATLRPSENYDLENGITIEGWFRYDARGFYSWAPRLINKFGQGGSDGYCLTVAGSGKVLFELNNSSTGEAAYHSVDSPESGQWFHLAATWDIQTKQMRMYIDGVEKGDPLEFQGPIGLTSVPLGFATNNLRATRIDASYSEIRIWNYARSSEQIRENKNKRLDAELDGLAFYGSFSDENDIRKLPWSKIVNPSIQSTKQLPFGSETDYLALTESNSFTENLWLDLILAESYFQRDEMSEAINILRASDFRFSSRVYNPARLGLISKYLTSIDDGNEVFRGRMSNLLRQGITEMNKPSEGMLPPWVPQVRKLIQPF